jgi:O-antigen/teichoic acid export membrane protein
MLLGTIILSRLYSPEQFGIYAVILGVTSVVSVASTFRYEMTILIPKTNKMSELALGLSFWVSVSVNSLGFLFFVLLIFGGLLEPYWLTVPVTAFFASIINISSFLQNRKKQYARIAGVQIIRSLLFILTATLSYFLGGEDKGLLVAMVLSISLVAGYLLLFDFRCANAYESVIRKKRLHAWARKNKKFIFYSTPAVFVNSLAAQSPVFLLSAFSGAGLAGYYMMIQRIMMAPVSLVSGAVNKVYLSKIASRRANGEAIYPLTKSIIRRFLIPSFILACGMFTVFNLRLIEFIFGDQWNGIDAISMVMIPAFCISFVAKSIAGFAVLGRNDLGLIYQVVLLLMVSSSILLSTFLTDSKQIIFAAMSLALSLCFLGQSISILKITKDHDKYISR